MPFPSTVTNGRRVLLFSRSLPPAPTGSAVIVGNLARAFCRDEMVLAGETAEDRMPDSWSPTGPEMVPVRCLWLPSGRGKREVRLLWVPWMAARLTRLIRERNCTDVLAVYPDEAYFWAAMLASRRTGCRFYPYFHNTYLESRRRWGLRLAQWLQPRIFRAARHVFVMSEGMLELYRSRYPEVTRCSALVHSFAEEVPPFAEPVHFNNRTFVLSGNINPSCRDAARRMAEAVGQVPDARLHFYTGQSRADLEGLGVWNSVASCSRLNRRELLQALARAELLLLPHGFTGGYSRIECETIFPTKTIEYLISGRPILAHSPPGVFLTRFLKQHDCALVVEEAKPQAVGEGIRRLLNDAALRARLVRNALETARMFHISRVAAHLREVLQMPARAGNTP